MAVQKRRVRQLPSVRKIIGLRNTPTPRSSARQKEEEARAGVIMCCALMAGRFSVAGIPEKKPSQRLDHLTLLLARRTA